MTIHEETDELYTYKECKEELVSSGDITEDTPRDEVEEVLQNKGFNDCGNCEKFTGTINLNWDADYILKDSHTCVCDECQHLVVGPNE